LAVKLLSEVKKVNRQPFMKHIILYGILLSVAFSAGAQTTLRGKVMDSKSDVPLEGATIFNTTQGIFKKAGQNGMFSIRALENDVLIVSSAGYRADTVKLSQDIIVTGLYIGLQASLVSLDTVTVTQRTYSEDSLLRRMEYAHLLDRPVKDIRGGNDAQYGFGVSVSPITYFSRKEKDKRRFRKQYEQYEQDAYIDYRFSPSYVHRVTGLAGEELQRFMKHYRPSYKALRSMVQEDLLLYINDSLKRFKRRER
jgi:hypothetical protein